MKHFTRPHLILIRVKWGFVRCGICARYARDTIPYLVERQAAWVRLCDDPCGKKALYQRCHQLGFGIAAQLQKRLDHLCQIGHATVLVRAFAAHNMQDIGQAQPLPVGLYTRPYRRFGKGELPRVCIADVIGNDHAVPVNFNAVKYLVPGLVIPAIGNAGPAGQPAHGIRRADAVGFHQMDTQGIGAVPCNRIAFQHREYIPRHQPGYKGKLLQGIKIIHPDCITILFAARPKSELGFCPLLPFLGGFRGQP